MNLVMFLICFNSGDVTLETLFFEQDGKIEGDLVKVKIDPDDILADALAHYKNPDFDPASPIRVTYKGQPAVDAGGVKRQFFTDVLNQMSSSELKLLEGPDLRKSPTYDCGVISSGLMKLFGTAVAHAIVQARVGIPTLSRPFYWYVATGDVNQAIPYVSVEDVYDEDARHYIEEVLQELTYSSMCVSL